MLTSSARWAAYSGHRIPCRAAKSAGTGKVRASLLAGIRAAVLWHQVGGGRLQLMFSRNRLTTQAKQILAHC
jgi:CII-binding regulator of phage lambda lysogenization HflD